MKVLSVKNPWAHLIVEGIKDVENRNWQTLHRGKVLIHASKKWDVLGMKCSDFFCWYNDWQKMSALRAYQYDVKHIPCGCIIGHVEVCDIVKDDGGDFSEWKIPGQYHWILRNAVIYEKPTFVAGALGLWDFEESKLVSDNPPNKAAWHHESQKQKAHNNTYQ